MVAATLHLGLYGWWTSMVQPQHRAQVLDAAFLGGTEPLDLLVAGDSHGRNAINDAGIQRALNISVPGQTWLKASFRLPWLLDQTDRSVSRVVLGLDHGSLSGWKLDAWQPEGVWGRYVDFLALGQLRNRPFSYSARWAKARFAPYAGELDTLGQLVTGTRAFRSGPGRTGVESKRRNRRTGAEAADLHLTGQNATDPYQLWAFGRLMTDLTARRELEVILVAFPVSRGYLQRVQQLGAPNPWDHPDVRRWLKHDRVRFLDFSAAAEARPEMFYDGDHLGGLGSRWFTAGLAARLGLERVAVDR
jgi:hypothetical protein